MLGALAALVLLTLMLPAVAAATDRDALMALYDATDGSAWSDRTNWDIAADIGTWYGVTTNSAGRVTKLDLYNNDLSGEIPVELGQLTALRELDLRSNELSGGDSRGVGAVGRAQGASGSTTTSWRVRFRRR